MSIFSFLSGSSSSTSALPVNILQTVLPLLTQGNISSGQIPIGSILSLIGNSGSTSTTSVSVNTVITAFLPLIQTSTGQIPQSEVMTALLQVISQSK